MRPSTPTISRNASITLLEISGSVAGMSHSAKQFSAQKCLMQSAVHRDYLPGCFAQPIRYQNEKCLSLVGGCDRRFRQGAIGVKLRQFAHQRFGRLILFEGDV